MALSAARLSQHLFQGGVLPCAFEPPSPRMTSNKARSEIDHGAKRHFRPYFLTPIHLYSSECAERYAGAKRSTAQFDDGYPVAGECAGDSSSLAAAVGEDV